MRQGRGRVGSASPLGPIGKGSKQNVHIRITVSAFEMKSSGFAESGHASLRTEHLNPMAPGFWAGWNMGGGSKPSFQSALFVFGPAA